MDLDKILRQMSNENTARTFDFNAQEAEKARQFSAEMSNTSHQREVEDLKRAGLNPVLSSNGGAQSYSASSASGSADNSAVGVIASIYQTKMNNDNARKIAQMQIKQSQRDNANALRIAKVNAAASNYASNNSYAASRYASDLSYSGHTYGVDRSKYGMVYNAANSASRSATGRSVNGNASRLGSLVRKGVNWLSGKFR